MIDEFEMTELYWMRYPPFRSELYNFETKSWNVDWKRIDTATQEAGVTSFAVNHDPKVDDVDIKILKYLKEDPTFGLAKVGKGDRGEPQDGQVPPHGARREGEHDHREQRQMDLAAPAGEERRDNAGDGGLQGP